jgi:hypothetical protein
VREHFYELGLDPQPAVLDEGEARLLANETLDEAIASALRRPGRIRRAVQNLIQTYGGGARRKNPRRWFCACTITQTRPDADGWLADKLKNFPIAEPAEWQSGCLTAIQDWRDEWLPVLENLKG